MKKKFIIFIMIFCMLLALSETAYILWFNKDIILSFNWPAIDASLVKYSLYILMNGMIIGISLIGLITSKQSHKMDELIRRDEKNMINADENEAKIKVLERKIKTLEIALENEIKKDK